MRTPSSAVAPVDRFNYGQKQFFWVMFWGGSGPALLRLRAVVHQFGSVELALARLPRDPGPLDRWRADLGAFIIHVYMGTAVVREGFSSVIRGEVSESWARSIIALWLREITGEPVGKVNS